MTRFASVVAVIGGIAAIGLTVSIALFMPILNWDLLAYVGVVKSWGLHSAPAIQAAAYGDVHRFAVTHGLPRAWDDLISPANPYRSRVATNPVAFMRQLPFYRIRPLYLLLLWLVSRFTATVSAAAVTVSAMSLLFSALVLSVFAGRRLGSVAAAVWPAMFCLTPVVMEAARLQTPDALATFMVVTAGVLFLGGRELVAALVLLIAVLIRTDLMLLAVALGVVSAAFDRWAGRKLRGTTLCVLLGAALLEVAVTRWWHGYGYLTLLKFTFVDRAADPAVAAAARLSLPTFLGDIWRGAVLAIAMRKFPIVVVLALGVPFLFDRRATRRESVVLYAALVLYLLAHWMLFPSLAGRFAAPVYGGLFAVLVGEAGRWRASLIQNRWNPSIVPISNPNVVTTRTLRSVA